MSRRFVLVAAVSLLAVSELSSAQTPRQAARQERRADRQEFRMNNRVPYYNNQTWNTLNPWVTRNQVAPVQRAANAAANATARAANATANVAAGTAAGAATAAGANARWGFNNPNVATTPQGWFYDYYSYSPTRYASPAANANVYGSATRFYDANNDGVYDSYGTFRDTQKSGRFDTYDRYDFVEAPADNKADVYAEGPADASRHTVTGAVEATKLAKVNGADNLVVRLAGQDKQALIVDLGPVDRWQKQQVKEGDELTASGPIERVGDKDVLIAESVSIGKQKEIMVSRSGPRIEGQVIDVTRAEVQGAQHVMAIVDTGSAKQIVDLGPSDRLKVQIEPQTKIAVTGVPVQFRDYNVVLAEQVGLNGQEITIERW